MIFLGQRSSSLHYCACFGRPNIARVLLSYGANPDLRDEDGKTALDKARERGEGSHRQVAEILQSPNNWPIETADPVLNSGCPVSNSPKASGEEAEIVETVDDVEMGPAYLSHLLPVFCKTFLASISQSVRKASLNILRKMMHYIPRNLLKQVSQTECMCVC